MGYYTTAAFPLPEACTSETALPRFTGSTSGLRFLSPSLGRWLSRDPIGERGGNNVYCLVGNDPILGKDLLGLLEVIDEGPKLAELVPEIHPKEYFRADRFWDRPDAIQIPEKDRNGLLVGGGTSFLDDSVECSCSGIADGNGAAGSEQQKRAPREARSGPKKPCCIVSCVVRWKARVELNQDWNWDVAWNQPRSVLGAWGHEQRHVQAMREKVRNGVIAPLSRRQAVFRYPQECDRNAAEYGARASQSLRMLLQGGENHSGYNPGAGQMAEPLPGTPLPQRPSPQN